MNIRLFIIIYYNIYLPSINNAANDCEKSSENAINQLQTRHSSMPLKSNIKHDSRCTNTCEQYLIHTPPREKYLIEI